MEIKTIETAGIEAALHAMRNPMNSWSKSDSVHWDPGEETIVKFDRFTIVGPKDKELSTKLQKAGPEHCKHLRMVIVWADITAPRFWWTEFDTYRTGVEKVSCSTMHKLMARPLTIEDFEHNEGSELALSSVIRGINGRMETWKACLDIDDSKAVEVWREVVELLPQSYLQKRTVMMSYAALRNIVRQRKGHKLKEWSQFIEWAQTLPESWMIFV